MSKLMLLVLAVVLSPGFLSSVNAKEIIYESEYQVLVKQHGEKWAAEDREIEGRLDALRETLAEIR